MKWLPLVTVLSGAGLERLPPLMGINICVLLLVYGPSSPVAVLQARPTFPLPTPHGRALQSYFQSDTPES